MQDLSKIPTASCEITRNTEFQRVLTKFIAEAESPVGFVLFGLNDLKCAVLKQMLDYSCEVERDLSTLCLDLRSIEQKRTMLNSEHWSNGLILNLPNDTTIAFGTHERITELLRQGGFSQIVGICVYTYALVPSESERAFNHSMIHFKNKSPYDYFVSLKL